MVGSAYTGDEHCPRDLRVIAGEIEGQISAAQTISSLLVDYPSLERRHLSQALGYAEVLGQIAGAKNGHSKVF